MAHIFDTGAPDPQRTVLQHGAIDTLLPLTRARGGYLSSVFAFGGVVRTYTDEVDLELLMRVFGKTPSIGIATGTRNFQTLNVQRSEFSSDCELLVYIATQHGRDMQHGRMESDARAKVDNRADPGLHIIMAHTIELLCGIFVGTTPDIKQIIPVREEEIAPLAEITLWRQTFSARFDTLKIKGKGGREWRTADQLLASIGWRSTTEPTEQLPPAPATFSTSVDADTDLNE